MNPQQQRPPWMPSSQQVMQQVIANAIAAMAIALAALVIHHASSK